VVSAGPHPTSIVAPLEDLSTIELDDRSPPRIAATEAVDSLECFCSADVTAIHSDMINDIGSTVMVTGCCS
jgi:hypothetical protein